MKLTLAIAILAVTTVFAASADEEDVAAKLPARPRPPSRPRPPPRPAPTKPPSRPAPSPANPPVNSAPATDLTNCYWSGTAPFCAGSCSAPYTEQNKGSCGDGACCWTGYKAHCCK